MYNQKTELGPKFRFYEYAAGHARVDPAPYMSKYSFQAQRNPIWLMVSKLAFH